MVYDNLINEFSSFILLEKNLSKNTQLSYVRDVRQFLEYCDKNNINFLNINNTILEDYLYHLKKQNYKTSSLFRKTEAIKAFYKFLLISNKIDKNPLSNFKAPKLERKLPEVLSVEDINKFAEINIEGKFNLLRTMVIIDLLYASGIRVSELINLRLESVDLNGLWIRVVGKGGKERIVPINENTKRLLEYYIEERNIYFANKTVSSELFLNKNGKKISRVSVWKDIKKVAKMLGIKKNIYPHIFRHSFATHLLQNGADLKSISDMLGHSSLTTTQIYTNLDNSVIKSIHKKYHPKG